MNDANRYLVQPVSVDDLPVWLALSPDMRFYFAEGSADPCVCFLTLKSGKNVIDTPALSESSC